ncbi:MAG TPA: undecaprenyl-diphosphate phosphatase [Bacteroidia bacterium]|nr:undecaprenyl-diphosphate phosphatase [Bacteroidia bacterium]
MTTWEAVILGIIEGITEFLPVSSTGHMIIASSLMGIAEDSFTKTFTVSIQFGAILSVVILYWKRFFQSVDFYLKLFVAFIPAVVFGMLLNDWIDSLLGNVAVVAFMLLAGGIFLVFMDKFIKEKTEMTDDDISYKSAFKIGMFQIMAMVPGVSRSAATIIGGLVQGLSRKTAAEFSFFLAVPTMFAAMVYKIFKFYKSGVIIQQEQISLLLIGNLIAFIVAILAIRSFIGVITKYGLKVYGYYRIVVGVLIILMMIMGVDLKLVD